MYIYGIGNNFKESSQYNNNFLLRLLLAILYTYLTLGFAAPAVLSIRYYAGFHRTTSLMQDIGNRVIDYSKKNGHFPKNDYVFNEEYSNYKSSIKYNEELLNCQSNETPKNMVLLTNAPEASLECVKSEVMPNGFVYTYTFDGEVKVVTKDNIDKIRFDCKKEEK